MKLLTREALLSFRRAPLLSTLSITTIAFSLFTLGLFGLVAINLREALRGLEERVEIVAFVLRGTPAETITLASQDIAAFPEVQDVAYVSEEQALARARRELVEFRDAYRDLQVNPLPASLEVRLKSGYRDAAHVERVAQRLRGFGFVNDVRFGREWVQKLDHLRNITGIVGLVIGLAFAAVAVVIIGVTIRLTLLQRAREISIMRLVGATNWFIRGPFLLEGALKGLLGGLLSLVLCYAGYLLFRDQSGGTFAGLIFFHPVQMLGIVLFGVLLGLGGSMVSVGRHLRHVSDREDGDDGEDGEGRARPCSRPSPSSPSSPSSPPSPSSRPRGHPAPHAPRPGHHARGQPPPPAGDPPRARSAGGAAAPAPGPGARRQRRAHQP